LASFDSVSKTGARDRDDGADSLTIRPMNAQASSFSFDLKREGARSFSFRREDQRAHRF
jgi:hypothetical protein